MMCIIDICQYPSKQRTLDWRPNYLQVNSQFDQLPDCSAQQMPNTASTCLASRRKHDFYAEQIFEHQNHEWRCNINILNIILYICLI